ncbi:hypothetical protein CRE_27929 [Caenorhabditis remanei]|uniref:DUF281 domain-containing protein n=1 Tax=Caenorhabditis remanei TaxID=31234 RepID=E3NMB1_CAERE|nr:hypothetical protein CRE_27929 [Caenorhabditis remanei]
MIAPDEVSISSTAATLPTEETEETEEPTTAMATMATTGPVTGQSTTPATETMCYECDINDIAPILDMPGTVFSSEPRDPVDGRTRTYTGCFRTDDFLCDSTEMFAVNRTGEHPIGDDITSNDVFTTFTCSCDGTYSWMDVLITLSPFEHDLEVHSGKQVASGIELDFMMTIYEPKPRSQFPSSTTASSSSLARTVQTRR